MRVDRHTMIHNWGTADMANSKCWDLCTRDRPKYRINTNQEITQHRPHRRSPSPLTSITVSLGAAYRLTGSPPFRPSPAPRPGRASISGLSGTGLAPPAPCAIRHSSAPACRAGARPPGLCRALSFLPVSRGLTSCGDTTVVCPLAAKLAFFDVCIRLSEHCLRCAYLRQVVIE